MRLTAIAVASSALLVAAPGATVAPVRAIDLAAITQRLDRLAGFGATGAVLLLEHDTVVLARGYGYADRDGAVARVPITPTTPFKLGSLSKQFTAAAIMHLEIDGRLRRGDRIDRFFPDAPADKRAITIEQLLTHTAGLPYVQGIPMSAHLGRDEMGRQVLALPLDFAPGARWSYSNYGYTLLALIVERASGVSFEPYVRRALFAPAGMQSTGFVGDSVPDPRWNTHAYSDDADEGPLADARDGSIALGAGSVVSTAQDMGRWARALRNGTVLPTAWRDTLMAPRVAAQGAAQYAYGWNVARIANGSTVVMHDGDIGGYNASMRWYPAEDVWLVVLSNARSSRGAWRDPLVLAARNAPYPGTVQPVPPPARRLADNAERTRLAGRFRLANDGFVDLAVADSGLTARAWTETSIRLLSATPASLEPVADTLSVRALRVGLRLMASQIDSVMNALHPSILRSADRYFAQLGGSLGPAVGGNARLELLGSTATSVGSGESFLRVVGARDTVGVSFAWRGGFVFSVRAYDQAGAVFDLAPTSGDGFVTYDPFTGRRADIRVTRRDASGAAVGLDVAGLSASRGGNG